MRYGTMETSEDKKMKKIELKDIEIVSFWSAAQLARDCGFSPKAKIFKKLKSQAGYRRGHHMQILKTTNGGYALYVNYGNVAVNRSFNDI